MTGLVLAMLAFAAAPQQLSEDSVELVSDAVHPGSFQPGEIASRVVTFVVPDGMRVESPDELRYGAGAESAGAPRIDRALLSDGRVRWTLTFPFTAWSPGDGTLEAFVLTTTGKRTREIALAPVSYTVVSALPSGTLPPPAAAERPFSPSRIRWRLLPFVPLVLAGLTGAGRWQAGRAGTASVPDVATPEALPKADSIELLERAAVLCESDPGGAVLLLAQVARGLPMAVCAGVTPATTGREAVSRIEAAGADELVQTVAWVLVAADARRFGRLSPEAADVTQHAALLGEAI